MILLFGNDWEDGDQAGTHKPDEIPDNAAAKEDLFNHVSRFHNPHMREELPGLIWSSRRFLAVHRNGVELGGHLMFNNPWFLVFSLEIVFLGFICLASGNFKSGYITFLIGIIFLSSSGMSGQGVTIAELLTPENVAALLLLFTLLLIFSLPFAHYLRPSCDSPKDGAQEER